MCMSLPQIHAANDTSVLFKNAFFCLICSNTRPLNLTEQMFLFYEQIAPRLISQKQLPLKKKQELGRRCFLFLRVALKTGTSQEIHKDRAGADNALLGLKMTSFMRGLKAQRQRRKCKTENNQKGDLLYLF